MNAHADKTEENKSQSVSAVDSQMERGGGSTFQFIDNRPEAVAQLKLQEMANNSSRAMQLKAIQDMANSSQQAKQAPQLQSITDNYSSQQPTIQKKENNTGLPDNLKKGMENLSGMSLDDVKVYRNSDKPAQLQAHAYAQGTDIHLGPGKDKHLPHEAWHVVQKKQGRVKSTFQMKRGVNVNDDVGLEKEADLKGDEALQFKLQQPKTVQIKKQQIMVDEKSQSYKVVQRVWKKDEAGKTYWEGAWDTARLMCKQPDGAYDVEAYSPPKLLFWNSDSKKYESTSSSFVIENSKTDKLKEEKVREYNTLLFWRELADMINLKESKHILAQIIDTIDSADESSSEPIILAYSGTSLLGISIYSVKGTTMGAPEIPNSEENWLYVAYSAADPLSQIPREKRGPVFGGVGAAMNKHYDLFAAMFELPVYRHAENPISYVSLIRAGYTDVYADRDSFELPEL
ncbi:DUF4157 domain-containing protein [Marivirga sp. S37H4]|uniref:DUF4157 domain-containing protein n=1 Tax=Marivirga aurantiaca TaxID=2802615 RepID=A0A935C4P8_9BACT|nr:DUF4157 domain-containing protein [Marivirga aurantiaca]MBK6263411.1 DUF4157 domain-containing protein [Marivirga aurantiaca]